MKGLVGSFASVISSLISKKVHAPCYGTEWGSVYAVNYEMSNVIVDSASLGHIIIKPRQHSQPRVVLLKASLSDADKAEIFPIVFIIWQHLRFYLLLIYSIQYGII